MRIASFFTTLSIRSPIISTTALGDLIEGNDTDDGDDHNDDDDYDDDDNSAWARGQRKKVRW